MQRIWTIICAVSGSSFEALYIWHINDILMKFSLLSLIPLHKHYNKFNLDDSLSILKVIYKIIHMSIPKQKVLTCPANGTAIIFFGHDSFIPLYWFYYSFSQEQIREPTSHPRWRGYSVNLSRSGTYKRVSYFLVQFYTLSLGKL